MPCLAMPRTLPLVLACLAACSARAANPFDPVEIRSVMRRVFVDQVELQKARQTNGWERAAFYTGVMAAYRATGDPVYRDQALRWSRLHDWTPTGDFRHADNQAAIQTYAELSLLDGDPAYLQGSRTILDRQLAGPRRGREEWWWCDALFMAPPALARMSAATGDPKYTTFMNEMWWDTTTFLFDEAEGLYFRDKSFFDKRTAGGKKVFWSRGNGWAMAGTARVLQYLPADHPDRPRYVSLLQRMADSVLNRQGADGLWRSSLLDPDEFPAPETSGTGFLTYALAWGVNNGILDRAACMPAARRAWAGLVDKVQPNGRLGYVQRVAAAPGEVRPEDTHEYGAGAFLLAGSEMLAATRHRYDFGAAETEPGYTAVTPHDTWSEARGLGWVGDHDLEIRDRRNPDALRRDHVFGHRPATFRVKIEPGLYRLTLVTGDMQFGNHVLAPSTDAGGESLPVMRQRAGEFSTLITTVRVRKETLDIRLSSPESNWVLNALNLEPVTRAEPTKMTKKSFPVPVASRWQDVSKWPDPIAPHVERFRRHAERRPSVTPTGLTRGDYLKVISGNIDFFKGFQDDRGAIIDPHRKEEFQYSTSAFAHAAALLVAEAGRDDLLEPAAKAMDWATRTLSQRKAASAHEDFYPPMLAHAYTLLKPRVDAVRVARWEADLRAYDAMTTYRAVPGGQNWNVVALSGEAMLHQMGLRPDSRFVENSLAAQGRLFASPWGLYLEGPLAYDHFPRLWAADMMAHGYDGPYSKPLREVLRRGALTSLFMQSPHGELPAGGRSSHHQWNEAEQCATYEIYAAEARKRGDPVMAGAYKRAARLALASMQRWVRPTGEMWIVKNRLDPALRHGYEGYSAHSQYNLLPMSMLAIAYEYAGSTESVPEVPAPAETGGFVLRLDDKVHQVIANSGGTYAQIDITADPHYNATGLLRVHFPGVDPQLGTTDALTATPSYEVPKGPRITAATGIAWMDTAGRWKRLAQLGSREISTVSIVDIREEPERVAFQVLYQGYFSGPALIVERYVLTPGRVEVTTELPGYTGPVRYVWPVHADNGATKPTITVENGSVTVSRSGNGVRYTPSGAASVSVEKEMYPTRNGWSRLAVAEYPTAAPVTLRIEAMP